MQAPASVDREVVTRRAEQHSQQGDEMKHRERTSPATTERSRKASRSCAEREQRFEQWRACSWSAALSERPYRRRLRQSQQRLHEVRQQHTWHSSSVYATKIQIPVTAVRRESRYLHQGKECQSSSSCLSTSMTTLTALFPSRQSTSRPRKRCDA